MKGHPQYRERIDRTIPRECIIDTSEGADSRFEVRHGEWFGKWRYDKHENALVLEIPVNRYDIDLNRAKTDDGVFDWIFHLACKTWITPEDLGNLVLALHHIKQVYR